MFDRSLRLPATGTESFFLWGPRQSGKTTLLRQTYPRARWVDLLKSDELRRYLDRPELLREELRAEPAPLVVIDEVQKVPALLDEVHWLIENTSTCFAMCGSSARKLRRGAANLLGGRALRYELFGVTARELGSEFDLDRMLNRGYLPRMYQAERAGRLLAAYVADYLREEACSLHGPVEPILLGPAGWLVRVHLGPIWPGAVDHTTTSTTSLCANGKRMPCRQVVPALC